MVIVSTDETCAAIQDAFEDTRSVLEPAGGFSIAGLKRAVTSGSLAGGTAVAIASGAKMNFLRLGYVTERAGSHHSGSIIPRRAAIRRCACSSSDSRIGGTLLDGTAPTSSSST